MNCTPTILLQIGFEQHTLLSFLRSVYWTFMFFLSCHLHIEHGQSLWAGNLCYPKEQASDWSLWPPHPKSWPSTHLLFKPLFAGRDRRESGRTRQELKGLVFEASRPRRFVFKCLKKKGSCTVRVNV